MAPLPRLVVRDDTELPSLTPLLINLLIALLVVVLAAMALVSTLVGLRSYRRKRLSLSSQSENPFQNGAQSGRRSGHRRLTITAAPYGRNSQSVFVYNEKQAFMEQSSSPPASPLPEIRITFPEEEDKSGNRKSGRVVVVRISDNGGFGLEPYEENLPPYQAGESDRFQSLDLERLGGLREKEVQPKQWA